MKSYFRDYLSALLFLSTAGAITAVINGLNLSAIEIFVPGILMLSFLVAWINRRNRRRQERFKAASSPPVSTVTQKAFKLRYFAVWIFIQTPIIMIAVALVTEASLLWFALLGLVIGASSALVTWILGTRGITEFDW